MIYVLEDDASIQKLVVYTLNSQGMEARGFDRPSQFWSALALEKPELVLLDIMLPAGAEKAAGRPGHPQDPSADAHRQEHRI